jgi:hypothetical protein
MEPSKQDLEQAGQLRPEEKKRRFRLVKVEEQRFRMDRLEDRIAPKLTQHHCAPTYNCSGSGCTATSSNTSSVSGSL